MNRVKDHLFTGGLCILILIALFALDDSYEDSILSAQVLDEAIAHYQVEQVEQPPKYELVAYQIEK